MREFVSKRSSLLGFDAGMGDDMDDPNNPYSSKGGLSGRSGFPRMSNATGSKESFIGGKSGRSGPGGEISLEDEANLTPQQLRDRQRRELEQRQKNRKLREDGSVEVIDGEYGDELDQALSDEDYDGKGGIDAADGNYHGTSFGQLPATGSPLSEIDPNDPAYAGLTKKQQLQLQLKNRQERKSREAQERLEAEQRQLEEEQRAAAELKAQRELEEKER